MFILRAYWLLFFIPLGVILWHLYKNRSHSSSWYKVCDPNIINNLLVQDGQVVKLPYILLLIFFIITIIALAGPSFRTKPTPIFNVSQPVMVLLDLSDEILAQDVKPDRLTRVKYKIEELIKNQPEYNYGLIAFSKEPFLVSPITEDGLTILSMFKTLSPTLMPVKGRDVSKGISYAAEILKQSGSPYGNILLITSSEVDEKAFAEAQKLKQQGMSLSVLGVGTSDGAPIPSQGGFIKDDKGQVKMSRLDQKSLQTLADKAGGVYSSLTYNNDDINFTAMFWFKHLDKVKSNYIFTQRSDDGYWLLFLIVPLMLLAFRSGWWHAIVR